MAYRTPQHVQEKKDAKRKHILDTALLVFADKGFYATSIQDICRAANVSVGSIYFYFKNKEEIYEAVYQGILADMIQTTDLAVEEESNVKELVEKSIRAFVGFMVTNDQAVRFLIKNSHSVNMNEQRDDVFRISTLKIKKLLDQWMAQGLIQTINSELAAMAFMGSTYQVIRTWNFSDKKMDVEVVIQFLIEFNLRGLGIQ